MYYSGGRDMEKRKRATEGMSLNVSGLEQPHYPPSGSIQIGSTPGDAHARSERGGSECRDPTHSRPVAVGHVDNKTGAQAWCGASLVPQDSAVPKEEEEEDGDGDDEDAAEKDRLVGMEMIHKFTNGKPVFSGPEDMGMRQDGTSTQSPESQGSTQLQTSGQDKSSLPTPDSQVL